ncbi:sensor histidine kinase [Heyndrickxia acidiproducens]|uniref:sensor histidine kinase n=1 Tax=Heyndrickxia acidiproducens TaxID=1121084 RepID=UPI000365BAFE|nr:histidine kinase [Heyndrickxia acidiproducens]
MDEWIFTLLVMLSLGAPIAGYVVLLLLGFLDKELDYLQLENRKMEMEKELHRIEYLQLNQQIQPHFLFNSLNAMLSLNRLGRARDLTHSLEEFSKFLRYKYTEKESLVSFERELKYTSHYISIQKIRFGNRLKVNTQFEEDAKPTYMPPYMLQTLVENAFKHGLEKQPGDKQLEILLKREGNWVTLLVADNGPGINASDPDGMGVGLMNIRKRLDLIYDLRSELSVKREGDKTVSIVVWPYTPEGKV